MPKLYCCCIDPDCATFRNMVLKLQVWGIDPTPQKDGRRYFFDVTTDDTAWSKRRRDSFALMVRHWPKVH